MALPSPDAIEDAWNFALPRSRIAQRPAEPRSSARLLVFRQANEEIEDRRVADLPELLAPGDVIVVNNARVLPARLRGKKETGGKVELLLLEGQDHHWKALLRARRPPRPGTRIQVAEFSWTVRERCSEPVSCYLLEVEPAFRQQDLQRLGELPTPPYIRTPLRSPEDYQTIFASVPGALAAPTASLHFDASLVQALRERGIRLASITLLLGPGSFLLPRGSWKDIQVPPEPVRVPPETVALVQEAHRRGNRVLFVGTTVIRAMETAARSGRLEPFEGLADLVIRPSYRFRVTRAFLTNFHLPRSTHLLLVIAYLGPARVRRIYEHALRAGYRFYTFGDAMLVL